MYYLERFGAVDLPFLEARQTISSGDSLSVFRQLQDGGAFRVRGTERSPRTMTRISTTGEFVTTTAVDMDALGRALYGERGKLGKLYRRMSGSLERHWCWAELMRVGADNTPDTFLVQPVAPEFLMISPCWYGPRHGAAWLWGQGEHWGSGVVWDQNAGDTYVLPAGAPATPSIDVVNNGNFHVDNAILTITASATDPIEEPIFFGTEYPSGTTSASLIFHADIPATKQLIIDCGARSVMLDGVDAYDDLELDSDHALGGWLRLFPGTTTIGFLYTAVAAGSLLVSFGEGEE